MTQTIADRRDIDFVLFDQLQMEQLFTGPAFSDLDRKTVELILNEARSFAVNELLPARKPGDEEGARFAEGRVTLPRSFYRIYRLFNEGEWLGMTKDPDWGGHGLPGLVGTAAWDYFIGANFPFMMFPGSAPGAGKLIETYGSDLQKQLFLKKIYSGEWCCTMVLTEPQAGSDLGALSTRAVRNPDGTYAITGNKIFITGAEQDLTKNIVHPVLARIDGAPPGIDGISLFLVPKIWVNDDGSLGEFNHVVCTGIEDKLGLHGSPTCSLTLGDKQPSRGRLLGVESRGLKQIFVLLNETRLLVGQFGLGCASAAYLQALAYARQRVQGKPPVRQGSDDSASVPIIQHPDIRRQLLTMKTYVEAMRSFIYYLAFCADQRSNSRNPEDSARLLGLIELLTPIAKGYVSTKAFEICNLGVQIHGGYGYTRDYPAEQLLRDCRVTMIYEGTNGIQAIDLLKRKLNLHDGQPLTQLFVEIQQTIDRARTIPALKTQGVEIARLVAELKTAVDRLTHELNSSQALTAFAFAHPLLDAFGEVIMAWMLLWRSVTAHERLKNEPAGKSRWYYQGVQKSLDYFVATELPVTVGKIKGILNFNDAAVTIQDASFGE